MKVVLERSPDGQVLVDSRGTPAEIAESMLVTALAGIQRELLARRVVQLERATRTTEHMVRELRG